MKDKGIVIGQSIPIGGHANFLSKPYRMLLHPARQLGKSATNAFMNIGSLLGKKPLYTPVERLFIEHQLTDAASKDETKSENLKQLSKVVTKANEVLATATAVFPLDLFPDSVTVDRTKVTITKRSFFWTAQVISIRVEDILNVTTGVGPFFGSLTVSSRVMNSVDQFKIDYFWRKDAIRLKHIIQGYVIAMHNKIEVSHLSKKELIATLSELGHDATV